jgi:hypothetical protein
MALNREGASTIVDGGDTQSSLAKYNEDADAHGDAGVAAERNARRAEKVGNVVGVLGLFSFVPGLKALSEAIGKVTSAVASNYKCEKRCQDFMITLGGYSTMFKDWNALGEEDAAVPGFTVFDDAVEAVNKYKHSRAKIFNAQKWIEKFDGLQKDLVEQILQHVLVAIPKLFGGACGSAKPHAAVTVRLLLKVKALKSSSVTMPSPTREAEVHLDDIFEAILHVDHNDLIKKGSDDYERLKATKKERLENGASEMKLGRFVFLLAWLLKPCVFFLSLQDALHLVPCSLSVSVSALVIALQIHADRRWAGFRKDHPVEEVGAGLGSERWRCSERRVQDPVHHHHSCRAERPGVPRPGRRSAARAVAQGVP